MLTTCSQSACCRRGQEGVWSLESSEVGALSPAWCTPCESGPVAGPRPGSAEVARARMSAQCVIKLRALEGVGVLDTNASKRHPTMSNALSPKRRPRRGKKPAGQAQMELYDESPGPRNSRADSCALSARCSARHRKTPSRCHVFSSTQGM